MSHKLPFLSLLDLPDDADERAVRRAYAYQLKKVDQERDPETFQVLREAYERALQWVRYRHQAQDVVDEPDEEPASEESGAPAQAGPLAEAEQPSAPQALAPDAQEDVDPATQAFLEGTHPSQVGSEAAHAFLAHFYSRVDDWIADNPDYWLKQLQGALADDGLMSLAARETFEQTLADALAGGWQKGHDTLFQACCSAFNWRDLPPSAQSDRMGGVIAAAIHQATVLDSLPARDNKALSELMCMLRVSAVTPDTGELYQLESQLLLLSNGFSSLVWVSSDSQRLFDWLQKISALSDAERRQFAEAARRRNAVRKAPSPARKDGLSNNAWLVIGIVVVVLRLIAAAMNDHDPSSTSSSLDTTASTPATNPVHLEPVEPGASAPVASAGWTVVKFGTTEDGRSDYWAFPPEKDGNGPQAGQKAAGDAVPDPAPTDRTDVFPIPLLPDLSGSTGGGGGR